MEDNGSGKLQAMPDAEEMVDPNGQFFRLFQTIVYAAEVSGCFRCVDESEKSDEEDGWFQFHKLMDVEENCVSELWSIKPLAALNPVRAQKQRMLRIWNAVERLVSTLSDVPSVYATAMRQKAMYDGALTQYNRLREMQKQRSRWVDAEEKAKVLNTVPLHLVRTICQKAACEGALEQLRQMKDRMDVAAAPKPEMEECSSDHKLAAAAKPPPEEGTSHLPHTITNGGFATASLVGSYGEAVNSVLAPTASPYVENKLDDSGHSQQQHDKTTMESQEATERTEDGKRKASTTLNMDETKRIKVIANLWRSAFQNHANDDVAQSSNEVMLQFLERYIDLLKKQREFDALKVRLRQAQVAVVEARSLDDRRLYGMFADTYRDQIMNFQF